MRHLQGKKKTTQGKKSKPFFGRHGNITVLVTFLVAVTKATQGRKKSMRFEAERPLQQEHKPLRHSHSQEEEER